MQLIINITVIPGSHKNTIIQINEKTLQVTLKAKPEHNQANKLLILALAEYFNLPPTAIKIISGHHSAHKRIEINRL